MGGREREGGRERRDLLGVWKRDYITRTVESGWQGERPEGVRHR